MSSTRIVSLGVCLGLAMACGCGKAGPTLVPVKGIVTVGGSEPFKKGTVRFMPTDPSGGPQGGFAITDEEGHYELKHFNGQPGIEPGEYKVSFALFLMPDGSDLEDQSDVERPKTATELGGVQFVPREYANPESDKFPTTVPPSGGEFDFNIPELRKPE